MSRLFPVLAFLAVLAGSVSGNEPAATCPERLLRESLLQKFRPIRTLARRIGFRLHARSFDLDRFAAERLRFRERLASGAPAPEAIRTPEAKAALLVEALQGFFAGGIAMPADDDELGRRIFHGVRFSGYALSTGEAHRILGELLRLFPERNRSWNPVAWAQQAVDDDIDGRVDEGFLGSPEARRLLEGLAALGLCGKAGVCSSLALSYRGVAHWTPLATAIATNAILLFLGFPPLDVPNARPLRFVPLPADIATDVAQGRLDKAYGTARKRLRGWGRLSVGFRGLRKAYMAALAGALVWVGIESYPMIRAWVAWTTLRPAAVREYEQRHYEPSAVVEEQLEMWRDAQDREPTPEELQRKRRELQDQEHRGVLRVYPTDKR